MHNPSSDSSEAQKLPDGFFALIACLLWSSAFIAIKRGYSAGATPLFFAGIRFFLSGLVLLPIALRRSGLHGYLNVWKQHFGFILLIGLFQTALVYGPFYLGVGLVPASLAAIVIGAQPLLTSAASHFIPPRERIRARQWAALVLGIAGLAVLSISRNPAGTGQGEISGGTEIGGILLLLTALGSGAVSTILVSRTTRSIPSFILSSGQFLAGGVLLLVISLFAEDFTGFAPDGGFWFALTWLVIVSSTGITLWFWLLQVRKAGAGAVSVWKFIIPVVGAVLGWTLMPGDRPDTGSVAGMLLIAGGVVAFFLEPGRKDKSSGL